MLVNESGQPQSSRRSSSSLGKWLLWGVLCALIIGVIGFFALYHVILRIPIAYLWKPYALIAVVTVLAFAAMYRANSSSQPSSHPPRRAIVVGTYMCLTALIGIYYAAQAGIVPTEELVGFSISTTIVLVISSILTYFITKRRSQGGIARQQGREQN